MVQDFVDPIEDSKRKRFAAPRPRCEDQLFSSLFRKRSDQLQCSVGGILAVRVHNQNRVTRHLVLNMNKPRGNGSLVTKIAVQPQYTYRFHGIEMGLEL